VKVKEAVRVAHALQARDEGPSIARLPWSLAKDTT